MEQWLCFILGSLDQVQKVVVAGGLRWCIRVLWLQAVVAVFGQFKQEGVNLEEFMKDLIK